MWYLKLAWFKVHSGNINDPRPLKLYSGGSKSTSQEEWASSLMIKCNFPFKLYFTVYIRSVICHLYLYVFLYLHLYLYLFCICIRALYLHLYLYLYLFCICIRAWRALSGWWPLCRQVNNSHWSDSTMGGGRPIVVPSHLPLPDSGGRKSIFLHGYVWHAPCQVNNSHISAWHVHWSLVRSHNVPRLSLVHSTICPLFDRKFICGRKSGNLWHVQGQVNNSYWPNPTSLLSPNSHSSSFLWEEIKMPIFLHVFVNTRY